MDELECNRKFQLLLDKIFTFGEIIQNLAETHKEASEENTCSSYDIMGEKIAALITLMKENILLFENSLSDCLKNNLSIDNINDSTDSKNHEQKTGENGQENCGHKKNNNNLHTIKEEIREISKENTESTNEKMEDPCSSMDFVRKLTSGRVSLSQPENEIVKYSKENEKKSEYARTDEINSIENIQIKEEETENENNKTKQSLDKVKKNDSETEKHFSMPHLSTAIPKTETLNSYEDEQDSQQMEISTEDELNSIENIQIKEEHTEEKHKYNNAKQSLDKIQKNDSDTGEHSSMPHVSTAIPKTQIPNSFEDEPDEDTQQTEIYTEDETNPIENIQIQERKTENNDSSKHKKHNTKQSLEKVQNDSDTDEHSSMPHLFTAIPKTQLPNSYEDEPVPDSQQTEIYTVEIDGSEVPCEDTVNNIELETDNICEEQTNDLSSDLFSSSTKSTAIRPTVQVSPNSSIVNGYLYSKEDAKRALMELELSSDSESVSDSDSNDIEIEETYSSLDDTVSIKSFSSCESLDDQSINFESDIEKEKEQSHKDEEISREPLSYEFYKELFDLKECYVSVEDLKVESNGSESENSDWNKSIESDEIERLCNIDNLEKKRKSQEGDNECKRKKMDNTFVDDDKNEELQFDENISNHLEDSNDGGSMVSVKSEEFLASIVSDCIEDECNTNNVDCDTDHSDDNIEKQRKNKKPKMTKEGSGTRKYLDKDYWRRDPLLTCRTTLDDNENKRKSKKTNEFKSYLEKSIFYNNTIEEDNTIPWNISSSDEEKNEDEEDEDEDEEEDIEESTGDTSEEANISTAEVVPALETDAETDQSENTNENPQKKGRKNIKPVLTYEELAEATKKAEEEEQLRSFRIQQRQRFLSTQCTEENELILDTTKDGEKIKVDPELCRKLYPHQRKGVAFMWQSCYESVVRLQNHEGSGCILAHCMGLGKTFQITTFAHTLFSYPVTKTKHILVICPVSTVIAWVKEIKLTWETAMNQMDIVVEYIEGTDTIITKCLKINRWRGNTGILVMGYEAFVSLILGNGVSEEIKKQLCEKLLDPGPDLVICDEGHLLKNDKSQRSKALSKITTQRRIVLTGTPMQNNLKEYYYMINFVNHNILGTFKEYSNRFVSPITNGQYGDSTERDIMIMKKRSHVLHKLLKNTVQRYEVGELKKYLKPIKNYTVFTQLHPIQASLYRHYITKAEKFFNSLQRKKNTNLFADMNMAKYICSHPHLLSIMEEGIKNKKNIKDLFLNNEENVLAIESVKKDWWKDICSESDLTNIDCGPKLKLALAIIEEAEKLGDKVLIFTSSLIELNSLEYFLKTVGTANCQDWKHNRDYFRIDGSVIPTKRARMCSLFNDTANKQLRVFLISYKVGGLGITLTAANRVIILGSIFNPVHDTQSIYRCYRFGQVKTVYVYRLISLGAMEEKIYRRCVSKLALASRVVDKHQILRHYDTAEIEELYADDVDLTLTKPPLNKPDDDLLATLILKFDFLHKYVDHQGLLENKPEEDLNDEDQEKAWQEFRRECDVQNGLYGQPAQNGFVSASSMLPTNTPLNTIANSNTVVPTTAFSTIASSNRVTPFSTVVSSNHVAPLNTVATNPGSTTNTSSSIGQVTWPPVKVPLDLSNPSISVVPSNISTGSHNLLNYTAVPYNQLMKQIRQDMAQNSKDNIPNTKLRRLPSQYIVKVNDLKGSVKIGSKTLKNIQQSRSAQLTHPMNGNNSSILKRQFPNITVKKLDKPIESVPGVRLGNTNIVYKISSNPINAVRKQGEIESTNLAQTKAVIDTMKAKVGAKLTSIVKNDKVNTNLSSTIVATDQNIKIQSSEETAESIKMPPLPYLSKNTRTESNTLSTNLVAQERTDSKHLLRVPNKTCVDNNVKESVSNRFLNKETPKQSTKPINIQGIDKNIISSISSNGNISNKSSINNDLKENAHNKNIEKAEQQSKPIKSQFCVKNDISNNSSNENTNDQESSIVQKHGNDGTSKDISNLNSNKILQGIDLSTRHIAPKSASAKPKSSIEKVSMSLKLWKNLASVKDKTVSLIKIPRENGNNQISENISNISPNTRKDAFKKYGFSNNENALKRSPETQIPLKRSPATLTKKSDTGRTVIANKLQDQNTALNDVNGFRRSLTNSNFKSKSNLLSKTKITSPIAKIHSTNISLVPRSPNRLDSSPVSKYAILDSKSKMISKSLKKSALRQLNEKKILKLKQLHTMNRPQSTLNQNSIATSTTKIDLSKYNFKNLPFHRDAISKSAPNYSINNDVPSPSSNQYVGLRRGELFQVSSNGSPKMLPGNSSVSLLRDSAQVKRADGKNVNTFR